MRRLAILGAGGHGKVVADAASLSGWGEISFYDDALAATTLVGPWPVHGGIADLLRNRSMMDGVIVAVGDNRTRLNCQAAVEAAGIAMAIVVHPAAVISQHAQVGSGSVVLAGAVVGPFARIARCCIVNTAATVDHDCVLGDGVHIGPGAHLGGGVCVGEAGWVGLGASVRQGVAIGTLAVVGAGAAVVHDVPDGATVVGVPARPL